MEVIQGKRQSGKTTTLIHLSSTLNISITTFYPYHINTIKRIARELELSIPEPILFKNYKIRGKNEILIDDLDSIPIDEVIKFSREIGYYIDIPFVTCTNKNNSVRVLQILKSK